MACLALKCHTESLFIPSGLLAALGAFPPKMALPCSSKIGTEDMPFDAVERLEAQLQDVSDVYIGSGWDAESYIAGWLAACAKRFARPSQ
ncbi:hypothetical protein AEAC466_14975 [Asticcacaulis sp. AC466]|nr:hypothetical protein AEAC466_14975 [Asticcacaulis sp. AC466]